MSKHIGASRIVRTLGVVAGLTVAALGIILPQMDLIPWALLPFLAAIAIFCVFDMLAVFFEDNRFGSSLKRRANNLLKRDRSEV